LSSGTDIDVYVHHPSYNKKMRVIQLHNNIQLILTKDINATINAFDFDVCKNMLLICLDGTKRYYKKDVKEFKLPPLSSAKGIQITRIIKYLFKGFPPAESYEKEIDAMKRFGSNITNRLYNNLFIWDTLANLPIQNNYLPTKQLCKELFGFNIYNKCLIDEEFRLRVLGSKYKGFVQTSITELKEIFGSEAIIESIENTSFAHKTPYISNVSIHYPDRNYEGLYPDMSNDEIFSHKVRILSYGHEEDHACQLKKVLTDQLIKDPKAQEHTLLYKLNKWYLPCSKVFYIHYPHALEPLNYSISEISLYCDVRLLLFKNQSSIDKEPEDKESEDKESEDKEPEYKPISTTLLPLPSDLDTNEMCLEIALRLMRGFKLQDESKRQEVIDYLELRLNKIKLEGENPDENNRDYN